jgi:hypothetical protein
LKKKVPFTLVIILAILLSACEPTTLPESAIGSTSEPVVTEPALGGQNPLPVSSQAPLNVLPATPQKASVETLQGRTLQGRYYPAAEENAPLVVLIHWVMANQGDWKAVAAWLQNRGVATTGTCSMPDPCDWWDPSWFPPMGGRSYAVYTYTLSGCEPNNGCASITREAWAEDANAAILYASQLPGIDPNRIVTAGASIGADAAIDSCAWLNNQSGPGYCRGSLAFSPGSYLVDEYAGQVTELETSQPPVPAWCLFAESDAEAAPTCRSASGTSYQMFEYAGNNHGMMLIAPNLAPKDSPKTTLEIFLDFLGMALDG